MASSHMFISAWGISVRKTDLVVQLSREVISTRRIALRLNSIRTVEKFTVRQDPGQLYLDLVVGGKPQPEEIVIWVVWFECDNSLPRSNSQHRLKDKGQTLTASGL